MGFAVAAKFPDFESIFSEILREADATLGFPLSQIIQNGPAEKLKSTAITQPALLTVSTAMGRWLKSKGVRAAMVCGHSLGEYSALVHAEALSFADAMKTVHLRGQLMESAVPSGVGGMCALIGADADKAKALCERIQKDLAGKILEPSAFNCPGQVVLSGHMEAIDAATSLAKEFGIRMATKLEVSGPFHCSLLRGAGQKLGEALAKVHWSKPQIPVIANTTGSEETSIEEIRKNLEDQVSLAVRWEDCVRSSSNKGVTEFVEVGSGKVLSGLIKKIAPEAAVVTLDQIDAESPWWLAVTTVR